MYLHLIDSLESFFQGIKNKGWVNNDENFGFGKYLFSIRK
jgi:hypothetical protein